MLSHSVYDCDHSIEMTQSRIERKNLVARSRFLIRPNDNLKFKWDILVIIGAVFNCICIPGQLAYNPYWMESSIYGFINNVIDFIFILDIIVSFRTTYVDDMG